GLRVFASIHQIFTVRRQWERPVWMGGPQEDGAKELYCNFQIERVESKERLRRIEHEVFSVLKSVFTAVEDYEEMKRTARDVAKKLRDRAEGGGRGASCWRPPSTSAGWPRSPSPRRRPTSPSSSRSTTGCSSTAGPRPTATSTARSARCSTASPSGSCSTPPPQPQGHHRPHRL